MYKLIKHNITEEHFDHPAVLPQKLKVSGNNSEEVVVNENTLMFRMDSRTLWTRFALGLVNYAVAIEGNIVAAPLVETRLYGIASEIGNYFTPYYGMTSAYKIGQLLTAYAKIGTDYIRAVKDNKSVDQFESLWTNVIEDIATYLNDLNPSYWPKELIVDQFTNLYKCWTDNIVARFSKDITQDTISLNAILKVAVTGIADHNRAGYLSIADLLSRGIVMQFPMMFV